MTDDMIALARRAVACRGWRLMGGMLMVRLEDEREYRVNTVSITSDAYVPDLTDPATLGCLLALVREAWGIPSLCVVFDTSDGRWHVGRWEDGLALRGRGGAYEAEALVAALEAAP